MNYCKCCGVEFEGSINDDVLKTNTDYKFYMNYKWINNNLLTSNLSDLFCIGCAAFIPRSILEVAIGELKEFIGYTINNYKEYPSVKKRIQKVSLLKKSFCPRCSGKLVEKESCSLFGNNFKIKKCEGCGWCE